MPLGNMSVSSEARSPRIDYSKLPAVLPGLGRVTSVLGEGGSSRVFEVFNGRLCILRAVKMLKGGQSAEAVERFEREMAIMPALRHANIVHVFSVGRTNGLPYIEMERLTGMSLDALIRQRGAMLPAIALTIGTAVCAALHFAHTQSLTVGGKMCRGVLHRDLKPANIVVTECGLVKLTDFGAARPVDHTPATDQRTFFGSLQYVAPEDLRGGNVDVRADIYSLGCVLFEVLTGRRLFPQTDMTELLTARLRNTHDADSMLRHVKPGEVAHVVEKCISPKPDARFGSVEEVDAALQELSAPREPTVTPERELRQLLWEPAPPRPHGLRQTGALLVDRVRRFGTAIRRAARGI